MEKTTAKVKNTSMSFPMAAYVLININFYILLLQVLQKIHVLRELSVSGMVITEKR